MLRKLMLGILLTGALTVFAQDEGLEETDQFAEPEAGTAATSGSKPIPPPTKPQKGKKGKAPTPEPVAATPPPPNDGYSWNLLGGLGYHSGGTITFAKASANTPAGPVNNSGNFSVDSALEVGLSILYTKPVGWGLKLGYTYQTERKVTSVSLGGNMIDAGGGSLQLSMIDVLGVYRSKEFIFPFGLNYTTAKFSQPTDSTATTKLEGGIGLQAGVGYFIYDYLLAELTYKLPGFTASSEQGPPNITFDFGTGYLSSIAMRLSYVY